MTAKGGDQTKNEPLQDEEGNPFSYYKLFKLNAYVFIYSLISTCSHLQEYWTVHYCQ